MTFDVTIIDYNQGNIGSIVNMVNKVGFSCNVAKSATEISHAKRLILPGVGSFDSGISKLNNFDFFDVLLENIVQKKIPILGICLGMQLLFESSEEGSIKGLSLIKGSCLKFKFSKNSPFKVPHMGWREITIKKDNLLFKGLDNEARFYFAHSFFCSAEDNSVVTATANYGLDFHAAIESENLYGVQFHPEKSHKFGMQVFRNFLNV
jgi:glutamine amidotransferase